MIYCEVLPLALMIVLLSGCGASNVTTPPAAVGPTAAHTATLTPIAAYTPIAAPTATPIPTIGSLWGRVFRSDTNAPIVGTVIELHDATRNSSEAAIATTADAEGRYAFNEVLPGTYSMVVIATFKDPAELPCSSIGLTHDKWLAAPASSKAGNAWMLIATSTDKDLLRIVAGDVLRKDIDLKCG